MDDARLLRGDCGRCEGLCCVSLSFERSEWFSFDKVADEPCRYLLGSHACAIHSELRAAGHAGCASYDCYGAGQRVVQELFAGASWRQSAATAAAVFSAFQRLKELHELLFLLRETRRLPLSTSDEARREELWAVLEPPEGLGWRALSAVDVPARSRDVHEFLRSLRAYLPRELGLRRRLPLLRGA